MYHLPKNSEVLEESSPELKDAVSGEKGACSEDTDSVDEVGERRSEEGLGIRKLCDILQLEVISNEMIASFGSWVERSVFLEGG